MAEKLLTSKPVRSVSYAEYMRKDIVSSQTESNLSSLQNELCGSFDEQTNILPQRGQILQSQHLGMSSSTNEVPEWLKEDIEGADFISIDALDKKSEKSDEFKVI